MLLRFFLHLREYRVPVSIRELLDLLCAMSGRLVFADIGQFYFLARLCLVKDEKFYDRFDLAFESFFEGLDAWQGAFEEREAIALLKESLARVFPDLSEVDLSRVLAEYRLAVANASRRAQQVAHREPTNPSRREENRGYGEQNDEQRPDEEWRPDPVEKVGGREDPRGEQADGEEAGDAGEEGEGQEGDSGEGENGREGEGEGGQSGLGSGQEPGRGIRDEADNPFHRSASKVWQIREFADYDPDVELGTRNMKLALRRLRKFARTAAELELDLPGTISSTARNGGILDIRQIPERHNAVKVLLFLDVGGSMDEHIVRCEQLFSAARSEFKHLEYYYFHNFIYESVWHRNDRRNEDRIATSDILHRFGSDYKVIFVGDASMARHEIAEKGGSVEHYNAEPGEAWLARFHDSFRKIAWLNPVDPDLWQDVYSIEMIRRLMENRMYHLGVAGMEEAMKYLAR